MFKKIISILLILASLVTLVSCGNDKNVSYIDGCIEELGQYKDLTFTITDEELETYIVKTFKANATYVKTTTGTVGSIDSVVISTFVTCDSQKVESLNMTEGVVSLGVGGNIPGFDEAIVGQEIGKEFTFKLTLPEDFDDESMAGKEAIFVATVSSVLDYPDMTDATVKSHMYSNYGITSISDLKVYCRNSLFVEKIVNHVQETSKINDVIQQDIDDYIDYYNQYYASMYLQQLQSGYPGDFSDYCKKYLNKTVEQLEEDIKKEAEENAKFRVLMYAICEKEGLVASDDDIQQIAIANFESYGYATPKAFIKGEGKEYLRYSLTQQDLSNLYLYLRQNNILGSSK